MKYRSRQVKKLKFSTHSFVCNNHFLRVINISDTDTSICRLLIHNFYGFGGGSQALPLTEAEREQ